MKKMKAVAVLGAGLLFVSCAPAVLGTQGTPYIADSATSSAKGVAGKTVYVQYTYSRGVLDIPDRRFDDLQVNFDARDVSGGVVSPETPASWLRMNVSGLPTDWQLTLADANLRKNVVKTSTGNNSIDIRYNEQLRLIYKITLPAGAKGVESARLAFADSDNGAALGTIPLLVSAGDSSAPTVGAQF